MPKMTEAERREWDDMIGLLCDERGMEFTGDHEFSPSNVDETSRDPTVAWPHAEHLAGYRKAQKLRRKLMAWVKQHPEWVAEYRERRDMEARIKRLCGEHGMHFPPHECPPWWPDLDLFETVPRGPMTIWGESEALARQLRAQLIAEIEAEDASSPGA